MHQIIKRFFFALLIMVGILNVPCAAHAQETQRTRLSVGILAYSPPWYDGAFVDETMRYLSWHLPQYEFDVQFYSPSDLEAKINSKSVDIIAASASFYVINVAKGLYTLGALASDTAKSPNRSSAATIVVRKDRTDLMTLQDLRGKHVSTVAQELSPGIFEIWMELSSISKDPASFFAKVDYEEPLNMQAVVNRVLQGEVDAGILRACFIEDSWKAGSSDWRQSLRVINLQDGSDGLSCLHSTRSYPGWLFAATSNLSEDQARDITAALLTKPSNAWGQHWSMATDYSGINTMYQTLMLGPYAYLREWTLQRIVQTYWPALLAFAFVIAAMAVHGVVLRILVRRRTKALELAYREKEKAGRIARETSEQLDALQRLGAVGQISSVVAHEMKQPLAVIQNLSQGILRILEDEEDSDENVTRAVYSIDDQARRAAQIIDRVRSYSQGKTPRERVELSESVAKIVDRFRASRKGRMASITLEAGEKIYLNMVPIDLELIVLNMLSNAAEAVQKTDKPKIEVKVFIQNGEYAVISVKDNGPDLTDEEFNKLGQKVLSTTKVHGLGLGIMIIRTLAEGYIGTLNYKRCPPHGLCAIVSFPLKPNLPHDSNSRKDKK